MWSIESGRNIQQPVLSWPDRTRESLTQLGSFSYKSEKTQLSLVETRKANIKENCLSSNVSKNLCSFSLCIAVYGISFVLDMAPLMNSADPRTTCPLLTCNKNMRSQQKIWSDWSRSHTFFSTSHCGRRSGMQWFPNSTLCTPPLDPG